MEKIKVAEPIINEMEIEAVKKVLLSGNYTSGSEVRRFEYSFAEFIGTKYAVACNSGTAALHMSLLSLGCVGEVIVPPLSFFASMASVILAGGNPNNLRFVDVDEQGNMDPEEVERAITEDTVAIMPVHLYGYPCQMDKIMDIAKRYRLYVIEDCAQAHGAEYYGKRAGSFGDANCFSFFATKNMTTLEGGMITTNNSEVAEKCRLLRSHGMIDRDTHVEFGFNYRMNEVSGAMGNIQLSKLVNLNSIRYANSMYIHGSIDPRFKFYKSIPDHVLPSFFWYPIKLQNKMQCEEIRKYLDSKGIGYRYRYNEPLNKQPVFRNCFSGLDLPKAESLAGTVIGLPNHANLTSNQREYIVTTVNSFFKEVPTS